MATRPAAVWVLALVLLLAGCSWSASEPSLFPRRAPTPSTSTSSRPPLHPTNSALPVAGQAVWRTADGSDLDLRLAVHAVRRMAGATVLDWSVTPLPTDDQKAGDELPRGVDLGLGRSTGSELGVLLVDPAAGRGYRPLAYESSSDFNHCLCTPVWAALTGLRVGETRLLQAAFPPLPDRVAFVDVDLGNLAPVAHVPVTPVGEVPTAPHATDLTRPAEQLVVASGPLRYQVPGQARQWQSIQVVRVVSSSAWTAVEWRLATVGRTDPANLPTGPPVAVDPDGAQTFSASSVDGPRLRTSGRGAGSGVLWASAEHNGVAGYECLCSELGLWAAGLRRSGGAANVAALYPPVRGPAVDLVLPEVGAIRGMPVEPAADAAGELGPAVRATVGEWHYDVDTPPAGWDTDAWPTPLPAVGQLADYRASVGTLTTLPRS